MECEYCECQNKKTNVEKTTRNSYTIEIDTGCATGKFTENKSFLGTNQNSTFFMRCAEFIKKAK